MAIRWKEVFGLPALRLGLPMILLLSGAFASGYLAWRESERARATARILMKDYASFIGDKFIQSSAQRYLESMGISGNPAQTNHPFNLLRELAAQRDSGRSAALPLPNLVAIDYFFDYDRKTDRLETSGVQPPNQESARLHEILFTLDIQCGANQSVPIGRLGSFPTGAAGNAGDALWSGLIITDERGAVRRVCGARLNPIESVRKFFVTEIEPDRDCNCPERLLPGSLRHIRDARLAASFTLRDGAGAVLYSSEPIYAGSPAVRQPLSSETPFSDWTVEVAINPEIVWPLLPFGSSGRPWLPLAMVALLVIGSAGLAIRSIRRETELFNLRRQFISNVSHELRTPLARVRLFNELLMRGGEILQEKRDRYRQIIDRECRRLTLLVDNILDFSRLDRGAERYDRAALDLRRVTEEALDTFRAASDRERFQVSSELESVPAILGDARALQQALINLLDNAVKYSEPGGKVEVRLRAADGSIRLSVSDQGCGIAKEDLERIFEPFYRASGNGNAQAARPAGSGLGLTLVRRAVEAHGGVVRVFSESGKGSTFVMELPAGEGAGKRVKAGSVAEKV